LFLFAGSLACNNNNDDIDMSKIDFSNIDDLYSQPLPVLQKCIEGKWKWYASYGGVVGISYPQNTFVEFKDNHYIVTDENYQRTVFFSWKKLEILDYRFPNIVAYTIWDNELDNGIWYFDNIRNDTLGVGSYSAPFAHCFIKVK
jgi:hypothetical protein